MADIQAFIDRYNTAATERDRDLALTHIAHAANILTPEEWQYWEASITPAQYRAKIINSLIYDYGVALRDDVPELIQIFGKAELKRMLDITKERYPSFNLVMGVYAAEEGLEIAGFFEPTSESPWVGETDFPIQSYWEEIDLFWGEQPDGSDNSFDFTVNCYPNEGAMSSGRGFPEWWFDPDTSPHDPKDENLIYVEQLFMDDWAREVAAGYQAQKAAMNSRIGVR